MADLLNTVAPEFDSRSDRETWLEIAAGQMDATCWGNQLGFGAANLAAHYMTLQAGDGTVSEESAGAGPVSLKKEGDVSIGYRAVVDKTTSAGDAGLSATHYGRTFLMIRESRACGFPSLVRPG